MCVKINILRPNVLHTSWSYVTVILWYTVVLFLGNSCLHYVCNYLVDNLIWPMYLFGCFMLVAITLILAEFTTMAGRRLRDAVKEVLSADKDFGRNIHVVLAGLTNTYSQYVTTYEEYEVQRYEVS